MKGMILAGGAGSRLYPLSLSNNKQLQPIYDKPMVYYPLTSLIEVGIKDVCIISSPDALGAFKKLLGNGSRFGIKLTYLTQPKPEGIAQSFIIAEKFIGSDNITLILGDNVFYGSLDLKRVFDSFDGGALTFAYEVDDPERYAVVTFNKKGTVTKLEEKPRKPKSNFAMPGLYIYDNEVVSIAKSLKPSDRGELEITDVNKVYLKNKKLKVHKLSRGFAWLDAGTSSSLHEASSYVRTIETRQGIKIGCAEEASLNSGFLDASSFQQIVTGTPDCEYKDYLTKVLKIYERDDA